MELYIDDKIITYIYGDSHCVIFVGADSFKAKAIVAGYDGASISGLNQKVSRLEYGKHILSLVNQQPKTYYHLMKLGQVDLEFIMYHKLYIKKEIFTFDEFCESLINKYREFINKMLEINKNVIIASINLPAYDETVVIRDYIKRIITTDETLNNMITQDPIDMDSYTYIHLDPIVRDFSLERLTKNFIYFNGLLRKLADQMGLSFFDTTDMFIDKNTNSLKNQYRCDNHHYKGYCDETQSNAKYITHTFFYEFFEEERHNYIK